MSLSDRLRAQPDTQHRDGEGAEEDVAALVVFGGDRISQKALTHFKINQP